MKFFAVFGLIGVLCILNIVKYTSASEETTLEKQVLSIHSIRKFLAAIDKNVIDRIRDTVNLSKLLTRVRKLLQIKLREGLNKRMESNAVKVDTFYRNSLTPLWLKTLLIRSINSKKQDQNSSTSKVLVNIIKDSHSDDDEKTVDKTELNAKS